MPPPEGPTPAAQPSDSPDPHQTPLTAAQQTELDRRLAALDDDRRNSVSWDNLKAELRRRCP